MKFITYSDGGARGNPGPAAIGVVICDATGHVVFETAQTIGHATNNRAEYNAMLLAIASAQERGATELECYADSELLVFQLQGRYRIKDSHLKLLAEKVKSLTSRLKNIRFHQVPREHPMISRADKLLNRALDQARRAPVRPPSGQSELFS